MSEAPLIVAAARTPVGTAGHALAGVDAASLAAPVLTRLAGEIPPDEVVLGNCTGPGGDVARVATLAAGLPFGVPALTVDRQCGSGLAAIEVHDAVKTFGRIRALDGLDLAVRTGAASDAASTPASAWPAVPTGVRAAATIKGASDTSNLSPGHGAGCACAAPTARRAAASRS